MSMSQLQSSGLAAADQVKSEDLQAPEELEEEGEELEGTEMWPDAEGIYRRQSQRKKPRVRVYVVLETL